MTHRHKVIIALIALLLVLAIGTSAVVIVRNNQKNPAQLPTTDSAGHTVLYDQTASRELTAGHCSGAGTVPIGAPMPLDQIGFILPYGLVVGGHVTPVDHQYYNGLLGNSSLRDAYDVVAPADGTLIGIEHRGNAVNTPANTKDIPGSDEYRLTVVHTCSFITVVDLLTSLSDNVKAALPANFDPLKGWSGEIPVKKGQLLGRIGGQTLDFFVWDLSHKLTGFINPDQYTKAEAWKLYTAPVSQYYDPQIRNQVIAKYVRTAAPIDGKIDYDVDGKLIGNWFLQGSGGYPGSGGNSNTNYFVGHLSIVPDYIDPTVFNISIGNWSSYQSPSSKDQDFASLSTSGAAQFMTVANSPDPATVDQSSGLVKYELVQKNYFKADGSKWDEFSLAQNLKAKAVGTVQGTVLVQLISTRSIKFEVFKGQRANQVTTFDDKAEIYTR